MVHWHLKGTVKLLLALNIDRFIICLKEEETKSGSESTKDALLTFQDLMVNVSFSFRSLCVF